MLARAEPEAGVNYWLMARYPPETRYAQSSEAKIAFQVSGNGPPDLVMAPGLVSHLDIQWQQTGYRRFVRALERGARVIRLDKRGTGLSDPVADLPTTGQRVQDVAAVMTAARSPRAVLFGLSDGGRAAIAFAAAHPSQVAGLILYGTSYRGPRAALLRRYRLVVRHWGEGRLIDLVAPSLAGPQARRAAGAFERAAASPAMAAALIESLGLIDVRDLMGGLTVPALVLHRDEDIIPVADARLVASQIPGATLKILAGKDHLPWAGTRRLWPSRSLRSLARWHQAGSGRISWPMRPAASTPSVGLVITNRGGNPGRAPHSRGACQRGDRRPAVSVPLHHRDSPQARLRQAWRRVPRRTGRSRGGPRRPPKYLNSGMPRVGTPMILVTEGMDCPVAPV